MDFIPECKTSTPFEVGRKQYNLPYLVKSEKKNHPLTGHRKII